MYIFIVYYQNPWNLKIPLLAPSNVVTYYSSLEAQLIVVFSMIYLVHFGKEMKFFVVFFSVKTLCFTRGLLLRAHTVIYFGDFHSDIIEVKASLVSIMVSRN